MKSGDCSCSECVERCRVMPGWMTPAEAGRAIDNGMASKLMLDWFTPDSRLGNDHNILVLCPASEGRNGGTAATTEELCGDMSFVGMLMGGQQVHQPCVMLVKGKCSIHDSGSKPLMCADTYGCDPEQGSHKIDIAPAWDTVEGRAVVTRWKKAVKFDKKLMENVGR